MKYWRISFLSAIGFAVVASSCSRTADARYVDLSTGKEVVLVKDEKSGLMVNKETGKSVYMYVDTKTNDTIYGSTGKVINGDVVRLEDGTYKYTGAYDIKEDDFKVKREKDGDLKIKDGDSKYKYDADENEK